MQHPWQVNCRFQTPGQLDHRVQNLSGILHETSKGFCQNECDHENARKHQLFENEHPPPPPPAINHASNNDNSSGQSFSHLGYQHSLPQSHNQSDNYSNACASGNYITVHDSRSVAPCYGRRTNLAYRLACPDSIGFKIGAEASVSKRNTMKQRRSYFTNAAQDGKVIADHQGGAQQFSSAKTNVKVCETSASSKSRNNTCTDASVNRLGHHCEVYENINGSQREKWLADHPEKFSLKYDSVQLYELLTIFLPQYMSIYHRKIENNLDDSSSGEKRFVVEAFLRQSQLDAESLRLILEAFDHFHLVPVVLHLGSNPQLGWDGLRVLADFIRRSSTPLRWLSISKSGTTNDAIINLMRSFLQRSDVYNENFFLSNRIAPPWLDLGCIDIEPIFSYLNSIRANLYCIAEDRKVCGLNRCGKAALFHIPKLDYRVQIGTIPKSSPAPPYTEV